MNQISRRDFLSTAAIAASPALALGKAHHASQRTQHPSAQTPYWLQATGTPGLTVALIEGGRTREVLCFGSTDLEGKSPVTEATVFQAASLSKQALLYAALKTLEAGKLDLERPLAQYLDKPYDAEDPDLGRITARHVLTHTTGWPNWLDQGKPVKRLHPPGEQWGYSGSGFVYLQKVLEAIWNEEAIHYTRRLVLDPLGMSESSFVWRDEYVRNATKGFDWTGMKVNDWRPSDQRSMARPAFTQRLGSTRCSWRRIWRRICISDTRTCTVSRLQSIRGWAGPSAGVRPTKCCGSGVTTASSRHSLPSFPHGSWASSS